MLLKDNNKTVEITMKEWDGERWTMDMSSDIFGSAPLHFNEDGAAIVDDVDYCIDYAMDWQNRTGDFADDAYDEDQRERDVDVDVVTKIRDERIAAGLTQKQLAEASGVNIRQIQKIESGEIATRNITAKNLLAIADALSVDPHDLL